MTSSRLTNATSSELEAGSCGWPRPRGRRIRTQAGSNFADSQVPKNVRPILFDYIGAGSEPEPQAVAAKSSSGGLFPHGKVAVCQALREKRRKHSRPIGSLRARVCASNDQAADTVGDAPQGTAVQAHKVTRIAAHDRRKQKRTEEFRGGACGQGRSKSFSISTHSLTIVGQGIECLVDACARCGRKEARWGDALVGE